MTSKRSLLGLDGGRKVTKTRKSKSVTSYFTNRNVNPNECRDLLKEPCPFETPSLTTFLPFDAYNHARDKENHVQLLHSEITGKNNLQTKKMRDFSKRMHIVQPPSKIRTVLDMYADFYKTIDGRPLKTVDDIYVYKRDVGNYAMIKQQIGYRRDMTMQLGSSMDHEQKRYANILNEYKQHVRDFQLLILQSHKLAVQRVHESETVQNALHAKCLELFPLRTQLNKLYGHIFQLDDIRKIQKKYRNFLNEISPLSWRGMYDDKYKAEGIHLEATSMVSDYRCYLDIDEMSKLALEELRYKKIEPHMYFTKPEELMDVFSRIELQCRKHALHLTNLAARVQPIRRAQEMLKESLKVEEAFVDYNIKVLEDQILHVEEATRVMKISFFRLLNTSFFQCTASQELLKLQCSIEYTASELFGKTYIKKSCLLLMKFIEQTFEVLSLKLDLMDLRTVNKAKEECFSQDRRTMRAAHRAARQLRSFQVLNGALRKSYLPPLKHNRVEVPKFQKKRIRPKISEPIVADNLTETERTNLILFTQWCPPEDPNKYLVRLGKQYFNLYH